MAEVKVAGHWFSELPGVVSDLAWSSRWGEGASGPREATWVASLPLDLDVAWLVPGSLVEVLDGGVRVWRGVLTEPVRGVPWQFKAVGVSSLAQQFAAIDAIGDPTTVPAEAVERAVDDGWAVLRSSGFSVVAFGEADPVAINRLDALLDNWAQTNGLRWGVDAEGTAFAAADPTDPTWILEASDVEIGVADDGLATVVVARFVSGVDAGGEANAWSTAIAADADAITRWGRREFVLDLTKLGLITGGTASALAAEQLSFMVVPAWVNRLAVDANRLRTLGGVPADLRAVQAGQVVRLFGVNDSLGRFTSQLMLDVVLGEVEYLDGDQVVTIAPVKLAARTIRDINAALAPRRSASEVFAR